MVGFILRSVLILTGLCVGSMHALAMVSAHVDRLNIEEGETVNLTVTADGGEGVDFDTAALVKDFEIISNNKSTSYNFINGKSSRSATRAIVLMPRHSGPLTIPALNVGGATTKPIMIQVSRLKAENRQGNAPVGDLWISMDIAPKSVRVQQQAIITIRVYQAVNLNQAQLSEPKAEHAVVEKLGDDSSYQKQENGRNWLVTERHYALFPQQSGKIEIDPVQLDGAMLLGGSSFFQTPRAVRKRSNSLTLNVTGIADNWPGADWLPAQSLTIDESWPRNETFRVGEAITRTVTIRADGLSASQLPALQFDLPEHLKSYPDKAKLEDAKAADGVHGLRQQKVAIMPMQPGTYILPEIDITWWNTKTETVEHASVPARTFTVAAGAATTSAPGSQQTMPQASTQSAPQSVIPPAPESAQQPVVSSAPQGGSVWWQWLALISSLGWLLTLAYLWRLHRAAGSRKPENAQYGTANQKQAVKAVKNACRANDAKACEQALLQLAHARKPGVQYHSLAALTAICGEALRAELIRLEQVLYGPENAPWQGDALLDALNREGGFKVPSGDSKSDKNSLPGLYPE